MCSIILRQNIFDGSRNLSPPRDGVVGHAEDAVAEQEPEVPAHVGHKVAEVVNDVLALGLVVARGDDQLDPQLLRPSI